MRGLLISAPCVAGRSAVAVAEPGQLETTAAACRLARGTRGHAANRVAELRHIDLGHAHLRHVEPGSALGRAGRSACGNRGALGRRRRRLGRGVGLRAGQASGLACGRAGLLVVEPGHLKLRQAHFGHVDLGQAELRHLELRSAGRRLANRARRNPAHGVAERRHVELGELESTARGSTGSRSGLDPLGRRNTLTRRDRLTRLRQHAAG